ncbi:MULTISPECIES: hypothetical protein [Aeromonas]|uniref:hypothetical protein n=1 Tax=Aeromonas TaxID=642 RepID=UPI001EE43AF1|nr:MULTISPECIES: hypothetical protein [Aeromonas]MDD9230225.1 hypothetical protein [Aeromonas hydrophila]
MNGQTCLPGAVRRVLLVALRGLLPLVVLAASCTYREDALGNTRYQCDDGKRGA